MAWQMLQTQLRGETLTSSLILGDISGFSWLSVLCVDEKTEPLSLSRHLNGNEAIRWLRVRWIVVDISSTEDKEIDLSCRPVEAVPLLDSKVILDIRLYYHRNNWKFGKKTPNWVLPLLQSPLLDLVLALDECVKCLGQKHLQHNRETLP